MSEFTGWLSGINLYLFSVSDSLASVGFRPLTLTPQLRGIPVFFSASFFEVAWETSYQAKLSVALNPGKDENSFWEGDRGISASRKKVVITADVYWALAICLRSGAKYGARNVFLNITIILWGRCYCWWLFCGQGNWDNETKQNKTERSCWWNQDLKPSSPAQEFLLFTTTPVVSNWCISESPGELIKHTGAQAHWRRRSLGLHNFNKCSAASDTDQTLGTVIALSGLLTEKTEADAHQEGRKT